MNTAHPNCNHGPSSSRGTRRSWKCISSSKCGLETPTGCVYLCGRLRCRIYALNGPPGCSPMQDRGRSDGTYSCGECWNDEGFERDSFERRDWSRIWACAESHPITDAHVQNCYNYNCLWHSTITGDSESAKVRETTSNSGAESSGPDSAQLKRKRDIHTLDEDVDATLNMANKLKLEMPSITPLRTSPDANSSTTNPRSIDAVSAKMLPKFKLPSTMPIRTKPIANSDTTNPKTTATDPIVTIPLGTVVKPAVWSPKPIELPCLCCLMNCDFYLWRYRSDRELKRCPRSNVEERCIPVSTASNWTTAIANTTSRCHMNFVKRLFI